MRPLVILRPEPGGSISAARAEKMGFDDVVRISLFKVRPVAWEAPAADRFDALLMTSANAARHAGEGLQAYRDLPVHAVGEATAAAARSAGMMVDRVGEEGVDDLLSRMPDDVRLLHLCGRARRMPTDAPQTIVPIEVYSSDARERPEGLERLAGAVACVHSARAGARLSELVARDGLDRETIAVAAISEASAEACGEGWRRLASASAPDDATLLALAKRLCEDDAR